MFYKVTTIIGLALALAFLVQRATEIHVIYYDHDFVLRTGNDGSYQMCVIAEKGRVATTTGCGPWSKPSYDPR